MLGTFLVKVVFIPHKYISPSFKPVIVALLPETVIFVFVLPEGYFLKFISSLLYPLGTLNLILS